METRGQLHHGHEDLIERGRPAIGHRPLICVSRDAGPGVVNNGRGKNVTKEFLSE